MYATLKFLGERAIHTNLPKSDERERERARSELWNVDPTMKKEEGFQFQTSQGMRNGKTGGVPGEKNPLVGYSENPIILILMRVSLSSKLRKTK